MANTVFTQMGNVVGTEIKNVKDAINIDLTNETSARTSADTTLQTNIDTETTRATTAENTLQSNIDSEISARTSADATLTATVSGLSTNSLDKTNNLSDLTNVSTARTNLSVDSSSEVDAKISAAELAMGSNYDVANITVRDTLTGLDVADRVFVSDDGDTKWALYKVSSIDANGKGTAWTKLMDQDALEISINSSSIKTSYEANTNTNAYTDSEKSKLTGIESGAEVNTVTSVNGQTGAVSINGTTNLTNSTTATTITVSSSTGTNTTLPSATTLDAGVMSASDKTTVDNIGTITEFDNALATAMA